MYRSRVIDSTVAKKLRGKGAVVIEGPKWCGKTTTGEHFAKATLNLSNPKEFQNVKQLVLVAPEKILDSTHPLLIDEWQLVPQIWDAIRFKIDHTEGYGHFILTGSAVPDKQAEEQIHHTGTGRFSWITMRTMSLFESGESTGTVSLSDIFGAKKIFSQCDMNIDRLCYLICRGGWPEAVDMDSDVALEQAKDYYAAIYKSDLSRVDGVKRNPERIKKIMRSYARGQGSQMSIGKITDDIKANDVDSISDDTVNDYINALKKIFVIEDMPAWNPNLRSKTAVRTSDTRYFTDPSIATAALGLGPDDLLRDLKTTGFLFEALCIRDLRIYAESIGGTVYHYRDKSNLECDAVIHLENGHYGLIEIKLGGEDDIEIGAKTLKKLRDSIDTEKMYEPSFLMVLIGVGQYAFQREDGVYVVPISCLKP